MEFLVKAVLGTLLFAFVLAFGAFFSGTIVWLIWPYAMVEVFGLPALDWWQAVTLVWLAGILVKSSVTSKSS